MHCVAPRVPLMIAVALSLAMLAVRVVEAQVDPIAWLRIAIGLAAMAFVICSRRRSIFERALLAFCIEAIAAVAMFVFVDAPFVDDHAAEIAGSSSAVYARLTHRDLGRDVRANHLFFGRR